VLDKEKKVESARVSPMKKRPCGNESKESLEMSAVLSTHGTRCDLRTGGTSKSNLTTDIQMFSINTPMSVEHVLLDSTHRGDSDQNHRSGGPPRSPYGFGETTIAKLDLDDPAHEDAATVCSGPEATNLPVGADVINTWVQPGVGPVRLNHPPVPPVKVRTHSSSQDEMELDGGGGDHAEKGEARKRRKKVTTFMSLPNDKSSIDEGFAVTPAAQKFKQCMVCMNHVYLNSVWYVLLYISTLHGMSSCIFKHCMVCHLFLNTAWYVILFIETLHGMSYCQFKHCMVCHLVYLKTTWSRSM